MDKRFDNYINQIVSGLKCSKEEKNDIKEEIKDHLTLLKTEYLEEGYSEDVAIQKALYSFGDGNHIQEGLQHSLFPYYRLIKISKWILFGLYSFVLLWNLLLIRMLDRIINYKYFNTYFWYPENTHSFFDLKVWKLNSNIIPFHNVYEYITGTNRFNVDIIIHNTIGNILIFIPLGFFLPILFNKYNSLSKVFIVSLLLTCIIELLQFFLQLGQFDIDDIILNTIGGIAGYLIIKLLMKASLYTKRKTSQKQQVI